MAATPIPEHATTYFDSFRDECWKRQLSNADNFDKAILTYSSGALALSLAVLKDFVPIKLAQLAWSLYASWALFIIAIVVTTISYLVSQSGLRAQLKAAEAYYLSGDDKALENVNGRATEITAWFQAGTFVSGIMLTTIFVSVNLPGAANMTEEKRVQLKEGAPIPTLIQKGAPVPTIQKLPTAPAGAVPAAPATAPAPAAPTQSESK